MFDDGQPDCIKSYVTYESDGVFLYQGYYHRGFRRGGWFGPTFPYYMDYPNRTVHDRFTVDLRNGIVTSVSSEAP